jgi:uncharacterized protein
MAQDLGITREEALLLLRKHLSSINMEIHSIASEAIMRKLAPMFKEDPDLWGLAGLLHDLDYDETKDLMTSHARRTSEILEEKGVLPDIIDAIVHHNAENLGLERTMPIHFALSASETITGMLIAATLITPEKKIESLKVTSVKKRMKAKEFARSVNRDHILLCEKIDIPLDAFIKISIEAMSEIQEELGL